MNENGIKSNQERKSPRVPFKRFKLLSLIKFELEHYCIIRDSETYTITMTKMEGRIETLEILHLIESSSQQCLLLASQLQGSI